MFRKSLAMESTFFFFFEMKEGKVSCVTIIAWVIVFKEVTNTLIFSISMVLNVVLNLMLNSISSYKETWCKLWILVSSGFCVRTLETGYLADTDISQDFWQHFTWSNLLLTVSCLPFHVHASIESSFWNCLNVTSFLNFTECNETWTLNFLVRKVKLN